MKAIDKKTLVQLYVVMQRIRMFEEKIVELYPEQEMKCPVHLCIGQEAIAAGVSANLAKTDYVFSNHRGHGHLLAKGASMKSLMAEFYGKSTGCSSGKGGSMHVIDVPNGVFGTSAIVGGGIPMGVGASLASVMKNEKRVTVIYFGDGAYEEGVFYESFNFASLKKLPVLFMCENNFYATNSPQYARQGACSIYDTAHAFKARGVCIDGNDAQYVYETARDVIDEIRAGSGPALIEARTYRWKGHVGHEEDHVKGLRPKDELDTWKERCPIIRMKGRLLNDGVIDEDEEREIIKNITDEIDAAVAFAKTSAYPDVGELLKDVYSKADGR